MSITGPMLRVTAEHLEIIKRTRQRPVLVTDLEPKALRYLKRNKLVTITITDNGALVRATPIGLSYLDNPYR